MLNRRDLLVVLPLAFQCWSQTARTEPGPRAIGVLSPYSYREVWAAAEVLVHALQDLGYARGKDFVVYERYADGNSERLSNLARDLVNLKVDVIAASTTYAAAEAQVATSSVPIVFESVGDPVQAGFADSLAHPGHNMTGLSNLSLDLTAKRLQLLKDMVPSVKQISILDNPANPYRPLLLTGMRDIAERLGVRILVANASTQDNLEPAFRDLVQKGSEAILVSADAYLWSFSKRISELALENRVASMFAFESSVEVGGLMSYGVDSAISWRQMATYIDKIFKGQHPGDIPIEQPTKFNLVLNRKTANALGLTIPKGLILRAAKVIE